jgi:uncharacterized membrane protein
MKTLKFKTVGFFSFVTKKIYKTSSARKTAETKHKVRIKNKIEKLIKLAKEEVKMLKEYISNTLRTVKSSFRRWSEIMTVNELIREVKRELPKQYRHNII